MGASWSSRDADEFLVLEHRLAGATWISDRHGKDAELLEGGLWKEVQDAVHVAELAKSIA